MPDYVRVRDKETGHHYSVTHERFERTPELWTELKQPATRPNGTPLEPKYKTTVSTETAKKASPKAAATSEKKES